MKQSIVALIRPKLNFGQKESQAAHLIEHILVTPKRLEALGISTNFYSQNIVFNNGTVNSFYLSEYYIVKSEAAEKMTKILLRHQNELFIDKDDFKKIKSALIEEILEDKGEFIDTGEQLARAIYKPNSPTIRNPWDEVNSITDLSYNKTIAIFEKYNTDLTLLELSFDEYKTGILPIIERSHFYEKLGHVELWHPWQSPGSVDTYIMAPLSGKIDPLISLLYRRSLNDYRFGILFDELRNKLGLIYDISVYENYDGNTLEIFFASSEKSSNRIIEHIKSTLEKYDDFIKKNLKYIKERLKIEFELDWGNIQDQGYSIIERVISGGVIESPASLIKRMDLITANDLCKLNGNFLNLIHKGSIYVKRQHGKTLKLIKK